MPCCPRQERRYSWTTLREYPASLRAFKSAGYQIWHLMGTGKGDERAFDANWTRDEPPALAEVTEDTLRAEETNAHNMIADNARGGG